MKKLIGIIALILISTAVFGYKGIYEDQIGQYCRHINGECTYMDYNRWCDSNDFFDTYSACKSEGAEQTLEKSEKAAVGKYCREADGDCTYIKTTFQICDSEDFYNTYTGCKKGTGAVTIVRKAKPVMAEPVMEKTEVMVKPEPVKVEPKVMVKVNTGRKLHVMEDKVAKNTGFRGSYCKELNGDCKYMKRSTDYCDSKVLYWDYQSCKAGE